MTEDVAAKQDKSCCVKLNEKYTKLQDKYKKVEKLKNEFRDCTTLIKREYDVIEKENRSLKQDNEEKQKGIREKKRADSAVARAEEEQKLADINLKKALDYKQMWEKLHIKMDEVNTMLTLYRSKSEAADKKVESEIQKTATEKKRADLAVARAEEQHKLAETNSKKFRFEKDRGDDLNHKLEDERVKSKKLEDELCEILCSTNLVETHVVPSSSEKIAELTSDVCTSVVKSDALMSQWMEKLLLTKEHNFIREKNRANSETK